MNKRFLFQFLFCAVIINTILTPISSGAARLFGYLSIILVVMISVDYDGEFGVKPVLLALLISFSLSCIFSLDSCDTLAIRKNIVAVITFFAFYSIIQNDYDFKIPFQFVLRGTLLLAFVFLVYSFAGLPFAYTSYGKYGVKVFSLGLGNPNAASVYVLFIMMVFLIEITHDKTIHRRIFYAIMAALMAVIILKLNSRTVIICSIVSVIAVVFSKKSAVFEFAASVVPFAMIPFLIRESNTLSKYSIFGKALNTGRDEIYLSMIEFFKEHPLRVFTGSFFNYPFTNLHNAPLTVIATIGIVGLTSVIFIWVTVMKNLKKTIVRKEQILAYDFLFLFIAHSSMESMSMIGTVPYCVFVIVILFIAKGIVVV